MGNIYYPFKDRPQRQLVMRTYIGYGHWILYYSDGTKELRFVHTKQAQALFYKATDWDQQGFPIWEELR